MYICIIELNKRNYMPNFKIHNISGIISGITISSTLIITKKYIHDISIVSIFSSSIFCYIMTLFPDMDIKSKSSTFIYTLSLLIAGYLWYLEEFKILSLFLIVLIIPQLLPHRGFLHSIFAAFIIPISIFILFFQNKISLETSIICYIAGVIGYCIHLILDNNE